MASSVVVAAAIVTSAALGVGLIGILLAERFDAARVRASVLMRRWLTWVAITAVLLAAVAGGERALLTLFAALAVIATIELRDLLGLSRYATVPAVVGAIILTIALGAPQSSLLVPGLAVASVAFRLDLPASARRLPEVALGTIGPVALAFALATAPRLIADYEAGAALLVATLLAVALGDVGAYIAGRTLKGPRLAPRISPAKRWSGLAGNLAGALLAFGSFELLLERGIGGPWPVMAAVVAIAAVAGDLFESAIKRYSGVKDAGHWLPGFGGLLDRIDSSLLALPSSYLAASLIGWEVLR